MRGVRAKRLREEAKMIGRPLQADAYYVLKPQRTFLPQLPEHRPQELRLHPQGWRSVYRRMKRNRPLI